MKRIKLIVSERVTYERVIQMPDDFTPDDWYDKAENDRGFIEELINTRIDRRDDAVSDDDHELKDIVLIDK